MVPRGRRACSGTPRNSPSWLMSPRPRWTRPASSTSSARRASSTPMFAAGSTRSRGSCNARSMTSAEPTPTRPTRCRYSNTRGGCWPGSRSRCRDSRRPTRQIGRRSPTVSSRSRETPISQPRYGFAIDSSPLQPSIRRSPRGWTSRCCDVTRTTPSIRWRGATSKAGRLSTIFIAGR